MERQAPKAATKVLARRTPDAHSQSTANIMEVPDFLMGGR